MKTLETLLVSAWR